MTQLVRSMGDTQIVLDFSDLPNGTNKRSQGLPRNRQVDKVGSLLYLKLQKGKFLLQKKEKNGRPSLHLL